MSDSIALQGRGVGKRYRLGARREAVSPLRRAGRALARLVPGRPSTDRSFWALQEADFDIRHGENVGLIGLNGAGKSTLLKILSRITAPTTGRIAIDGRVGALLEVGTGFHGDLTGRENVFLYGSILGMNREEVRQKFEAIVEFSGTADFIDTPVKRYSSGMYVRLAFSVAAHLEPEILLLDEVLAVGDLPFQRKCMEFAKGMQQRDATILFVSHNMFSIKTMCERVIYLRKGRIVFDGPTAQGIAVYEEDCRQIPLEFQGLRDHVIRVRDCRILDDRGRETQVFRYGDRMRIRIPYDPAEPVVDPGFVVAIARSDEVVCCNFSSESDGLSLGQVREPGVLELVTPPLKLVAEQYRMFVLVRRRGFQELIGAYGPTPFHMAHELFDTHFGVFHEAATWNRVEALDEPQAATSAAERR